MSIEDEEKGSELFDGRPAPPCPGVTNMCIGFVMISFSVALVMYGVRGAALMGNYSSLERGTAGDGIYLGVPITYVKQQWGFPPDMCVNVVIIFLTQGWIQALLASRPHGGPPLS